MPRLTVEAGKIGNKATQKLAAAWRIYQFLMKENILFRATYHGAFLIKAELGQHGTSQKTSKDVVRITGVCGSPVTLQDASHVYLHQQHMHQSVYQDTFS
jgi:hypothetical protein